ncbi:hypothetical protein [Streptomyces xanthochromogenes]|uniref:hypothetical protein n=1 Tax=Streptomyces xanthochromogenes TaxID=67384 RepID=UPI00341B323C
MGDRFRCRPIDLGVFLSGQGADGLDDFVGGGSAGLGRAHFGRRLGRVERHAELDGDAVMAGQAPAYRLEAFGARQRHRDHWGAGGQGDPGDAGSSTVELAVKEAGSLGADAEGPAAILIWTGLRPVREVASTR